MSADKRFGPRHRPPDGGSPGLALPQVSPLGNHNNVSSLFAMRHVGLALQWASSLSGAVLFVSQVRRGAKWTDAKARRILRFLGDIKLAVVVAALLLMIVRQFRRTFAADKPDISWLVVAVLVIVAYAVYTSRPLSAAVVATS